MAFEFFFEEKIWYLSATFETFQLSRLNDYVMDELQNRIAKRKHELKMKNNNDKTSFLSKTIDELVDSNSF